MRLWLHLSVCLLGLALSAAPCRAHGVEGYIENITGACVYAGYDDGEPMAYAAVEVRPEGAKLAFQTGRTDRNGCFMFRPDGPGRWQVVVNDGMGHRLALDYEAAADPTTAEPHATPRARDGGLTRAVKIITGMAVIFGICGFFYGWQARREPV
ncbi:MAG: hypothetical protein JW781_02365 [Deltaproteobacteria bacterium]|nr:hypothetical protein [Candidatus Anaeroferrophillacea bacterium]